MTEDLASEITRILRQQSTSNESPSHPHLNSVINFLHDTPSSETTHQTSIIPSNSATSIPTTHWFCPLVKSKLHRDAATFLIFLFAYKREGTTKEWIEKLEKVLAICESCSRGFGAARRLFEEQYLSNFSHATRVNFFKAVDKWQSDFIMTEFERVSQPTYGSITPTTPTLFNLPTSFLQLFFNEPSLLSHSSLSNLLDSTIATSTAVSDHHHQLKSIAFLGLTPLLINLLKSPDLSRRKWAIEQLPLTSRHPITLADWFEGGAGQEVVGLYEEAWTVDREEMWRTVKAVVQSGGLSLPVLQQGLIEGKTSKEQSKKGIMAALSTILGTESKAFPEMLECFATLLRLSPTRYIWCHDRSPEFPHTLFSDIKNNPSFQRLLTSQNLAKHQGIRKSQERVSSNRSDGDPLGWITDFLISLSENQNGEAEVGAGLSEALARSMSFCFVEMQHARLDEVVRAACAEAGCTSLIALHLKLKSTSALSATIDVHANFIANVGFNTPSHPPWSEARTVARQLVDQIFRADGRDLLEGVLGMGLIAHTERARLKKMKRTKHPSSVHGCLAPVSVNKLNKVVVQEQLWSAVYGVLSTLDSSGAALILRATAPFAHIDVLCHGWDGDDLEQVVDKADWEAGVNAINNSIRAMRRGFPAAIESISPIPEILDAIWESSDTTPKSSALPGMIGSMNNSFAAKAAIVLLLSPVDSIHEPVINLLQQSFDVDDRADCFRALLSKFPGPAMEGLAQFLNSFISTAKVVPEACSLAKWLVRCFTDILDVLCQSHDSDPPLLQTESFITFSSRGKRMSTRVEELWNLMSNGLGLIFKKTLTWAPYYENSVMVDWMRDALIFGRGMTDYIRAFEAAALSKTDGFQEKGVGGGGGGGGPSGSMGSGAGFGIGESPAKMTHVGKSLVQKLETILSDLVLWLRLTDAETLHQTFELIKTILSRIAAIRPDLSTSPTLEGTLIEIDKFCRRVSTSYNCRLTDDRLSELAELLEAFDLPLQPSDQGVSASVASGGRGVIERETGRQVSSPISDGELRQQSGKGKGKEENPPQRPTQDAFKLMMQSSGKGKSTTTTTQNKPSSTSSPVSSSSTTSVSAKQSRQAKIGQALPGSKAFPITVDEFDDDPLLDNLSPSDLDIIQRQAEAASAHRKMVRSTPKPSTSTLPGIQGSSGRDSNGYANPNILNINVVPKMYPPAKSLSSSSSRTNFKSQLFRDAVVTRRFDAAPRFDGAPRRKADDGSITAPRLPDASGLGTGLGAYRGPVVDSKTTRTAGTGGADSGSSASESSDDDDDGSGLASLMKKAKSPIQKRTIPTILFPERRSIKLLDTNSRDILRYREIEDKRQAALRMKMRLRPDLNPLYRIVLAWDPTNTSPILKNLSKEFSHKSPVPTTFTSFEQYNQIMLPLYLQELWCQFLKGDSDSTTQNLNVIIEIQSRAYEDDFIDLEVVAAQFPPSLFLNDTDIIILKPQQLPPQQQQGQLGDGSVSKPIFAKVVKVARKFKDSVIKLRILGKMDQNGLGTRAKWILKKHMSLNTALREFSALKGLPYYEEGILAHVLAARSAIMPSLDEDNVKSAMKTYNVNEPQAKAILGSMSVRGFALIQGPPGTGKTKTIAGLVGKFLTERKSQIVVAGSGEKPIKAKLLVCAPSNAAIDEVCKRLVDGVPSPQGRLTPSIVRIGMETSVNLNVKDVSLDSLVEARVTSDALISGERSGGGGGDYIRLQNELDQVKLSIKIKQEELRKVKTDLARRQIENEIHTLQNQRSKLGQSLSKTKDAARDATRHLEGARRTAKEAILNEADVICATLSGAGQDILAGYSFETVIIDEAAQAIELSCLIPLKYGCQRCIMVGDPNQLPPTTFSTDAENLKYNQSLFVRIAQQKNSHMHLLSIQYRMHPFISELPSKIFYHGLLKDGPDMATKTAAIWHHRQSFGPYRFFNVNGNEIRAGTSTKNPTEANVAVELYRSLDKEFGERVNLGLRIGVITMYREQLYELKRKFNEVFGGSILEMIEFNTVDGFQGQEKDIIILSCVRSGPNLTSIGFLRDFRRMNVALTRAKSSLWVIGNANTLERIDERWKVVVGDARERGFLVDYDAKTFDPTSHVPQKIPTPSVSPRKESIDLISKEKNKDKTRPRDDDTESVSSSTTGLEEGGLRDNKKKKKKKSKDKEKRNKRVKEKEEGKEKEKEKDADKNGLSNGKNQLTGDGKQGKDMKESEVASEIIDFTKGRKRKSSIISSLSSTTSSSSDSPQLLAHHSPEKKQKNIGDKDTTLGSISHLKSKKSISTPSFSARQPSSLPAGQTMSSIGSNQSPLPLGAPPPPLPPSTSSSTAPSPSSRITYPSKQGGVGVYGVAAGKVPGLVRPGMSVPPAPRPLPTSAPTRSAEDVVFIKKKKKLPSTGLKASMQNVREPMIQRPGGTGVGGTAPGSGSGSGNNGSALNRLPNGDSSSSTSQDYRPGSAAQGWGGRR